MSDDVKRGTRVTVYVVVLPRGTERHIGIRLRAARAQRGLSRERLAVASGLSHAAIVQIESGRRRQVRIETVRALAGALEVSVDYLVGGAPCGVAMLDHRALMHQDDDALLHGIVPFLEQGAARGHALLVVLPKPKISRLKKALGRASDQVDMATSSSWYRTPGSAMRRYREFVEDRLTHGAPWVSIVGEPVWGGRSVDEVGAWHRYEALVNVAFAAAAASLICPYDERTVPRKVIADAHRTHGTDPEGFLIDLAHT